MNWMILYSLDKNRNNLCITSLGFISGVIYCMFHDTEKYWCYKNFCSNLTSLSTQDFLNCFVLISVLIRKGLLHRTFSTPLPICSHTHTQTQTHTSCQLCHISTYRVEKKLQHETNTCLLISYLFVDFSFIHQMSKTQLTANRGRMFKSGEHISTYILQTLFVCTLVGSKSLVDPVAQVGHTGIHSGGAHVAVRGTPGHNSHEGPHSIVLTDQRATRVTLQWDKYGF